MKYRWEILWSDGHRDTCVYAVERSLAEWGARRCIKDGIAFALEPVEPVQVWFIPEEG